MRIEHNGQYLIQNTLFGVKSKIPTEKDAAQIFSGNVAREPDQKENGEFIFTQTEHDDRTFTKFFKVDKLKDFSLEFLGSGIKSKVN